MSKGNNHHAGGMVLTEEDCRKEIFSSGITSHSDMVNGHIHEGWKGCGFTCVEEDNSGGVYSVIMKSQSGQCYSFLSVGWNGFFEDDTLIISPVKEVVETIDSSVISPCNYIDEGSQQGSLIKEIMDNGPIPLFMMGKFSAPATPVSGGNRGGEPIKGFVGEDGDFVYGHDNGEMFHDREYSEFHSIVIDGQQYVLCNDVHSEDSTIGGDFTVTDGQLTFEGDIYKVGDRVVSKDFTTYESGNYSSIEVVME